MALNESLQTEEITIHTVRTLLSRAERNSYIEDAEKVFEQFDLGRLGTRYCPEFSFRENLIREADRSDIYNEAKRLSAMKQFLPELDRIYAGRISLPKLSTQRYCGPEWIDSIMILSRNVVLSANF